MESAAKVITIETLQFELREPSELRLSGTLSSAAAHKELARRLVLLHEELVAHHQASLTVDIRELSFVNSSALRVFVDWIARAERARYKLVFAIDRRVTWHRLSFAALQSLAPTTVELRDLPAAVP